MSSIKKITPISDNLKLSEAKEEEHLMGLLGFFIMRKKDQVN